MLGVKIRLPLGNDLEEMCAQAFRWITRHVETKTKRILSRELCAATEPLVTSHQLRIGHSVGALEVEIRLGLFDALARGAHLRPIAKYGLEVWRLQLCQIIEPIGEYNRVRERGRAHFPIERDKGAPGLLGGHPGLRPKSIAFPTGS